MEVNKAVAAVLVAGIAFFITGTIGMSLVHESVPEKTAIKIEGVVAAPTGAAKPAPLPPIAPFLASADEKAGEAFAKKVCAACHTFNQGGKPGVGPNLYGVLGAKHGHEEGFNYSTALKSKEGPWTYEELNEWLHKPSSYAPGTRMSFAGIPSEKERANVIVFIRSLSPNPEPLPPVQPAAAPAPAAGEAAPAKPAANPAPGAASPAPGAAKPTGASEGTQPSATSNPPAEGSPTANRAQQTQPGPNLGAGGAGTPAPAAKSP
jgi:cytochrome c